MIATATKHYSFEIIQHSTLQLRRMLTAGMRPRPPIRHCAVLKIMCRYGHYHTAWVVVGPHQIWDANYWDRRFHCMCVSQSVFVCHACGCAKTAERIYVPFEVEIHGYPTQETFTEFTEAVNENTDGRHKHRLSLYNAHYLNYTFTWFPVPVPYEREIKLI